MPSKKTTLNFKEYKNKLGRKSLLMNALVIGGSYGFWME